MKAIDAIRTVVAKTNPSWPFSSLNRMPYRLAIKAFVQLCKRFPEIKSVYLRHSLVRKDWVPAISDIDLTVIIRHQLSADEELAFLRSFWNNCDALKKVFPMLRDINILNDEHSVSYTKFTILGYESKEWKLIHGVEGIESSYIATPARLAADSFDHALMCYLNSFLKRFYEPQQPTYLRTQEMQRLRAKILRYANYFEPDACRVESDHRVVDKTEMLCSIVHALEKRVRYGSPLTDSVNSVESAGEWLIDFEPRDVFLKDQPLDLKELAPFGDAIESIYFSYQNNIIVLRDGLDVLSIKRCAELVARVLLDKKPAIVSRSIFERMVRFYNPFLYTHLVLCRMVAYGKDVLPDMQPPSRALFIIKVLEQTANILTFPQSHELILQSNPDWFAGRVLDSVVERALFIKLYLENRIIKPWHGRLLAECREHYPQYCKEFCELQGRAGSAGASSLSEETFRLLKGLANDVHKDLMESSLVLEELFRTRQGESNIRKMGILL